MTSLNSNYKALIKNNSGVSPVPAPTPFINLEGYTDLKSLPPFKKAGRKLTAGEKNIIKKFVVELLKKDPKLTIAKVAFYLGIRRATLLRTIGDLKTCFQHSISLFSPIKKTVAYKPTRNNKTLNKITQVALFRNLPKDACMVCGITSHVGHPFLEFGELDHINKDRSDNNLINLRVICPSCHAMCTTTGSEYGTPNLNLETIDIKRANLYNSPEQMLENPQKKKRINAQSGIGRKPYSALKVGQLFRVYTKEEGPKNTGSLADRLVAEGIKKPACELCGVKTWRGLPIGTFLQLHHKDENPLNNEVQNLALICGNCHKLEHKEGIPVPGEFPACNYDMNLPDIKKIQKALGPVLKRRDMRALARELAIPPDRLETIGKSCFKELWFPATEKRGPRDFLTSEGLEAIKQTLKALQANNFRYDDTRIFLRQNKGTEDKEHRVPEPLFTYIYKCFSGEWKRGNLITDPTLLPTDTKFNS